MKLCRDVGYPAGKIIASSTILLEYCPGGDIFGYIKVFVYLPDPFDPKTDTFKKFFVLSSIAKIRPKRIVV